jgi:hypothetical protein
MTLVSNIRRLFGRVTITDDSTPANIIDEFEVDNGEDVVYVVKKKYYVRPAGTTYGTGDGLTYANAWSGFSAINWSVLPNNILAICGTHFQELIVGADDVIIIGNDINQTGLIDAENTRSRCVQIASRNNITINNLEMQRGTTDGLLISGTSTNIITNNCEFSNTGNQGIQHLNTVQAVHNNPICRNNADDGISVHDSCNVVINGGIMDGNNHQINTIADSTIIVNGTTFINTGQYDVYVLNSNTLGSVSAVVNDCVLAVNSCINGSLVTFNNCEMQELQLSSSALNLKSNVTLNNCVVQKLVNGNNILEVNDSKIKETSFNTLSTQVYKNSYILGVGSLNSNNDNNDIKFERCLFDSSLITATTGLDVTRGNMNVNHCIFINNTSNKFECAIRATAGIVIFDNNILIGNGTTRGFFNAKTGGTVVNNNIIINSGTGLFANQPIVSNNTLFFNNTANTSGTVTQNNSLTADPLFTDISSKDFRLLTGSPAIGSGVVVSDIGGIDTANWNVEPPIVVLKNQPSPPNRGAYTNL